MPRPNFFNDNINRSFPFRVGTVGINVPETATDPVTMLQLPDQFIADCGFIMGPESGFDESLHHVFLYEITSFGGGLVTFEFRSDVDRTPPLSLTFTRTLEDPLYTTEFVEAAPESECDEPPWSGYLVTGDMSKIADRLFSVSYIRRSADTQTIVEPALIQNLNENQVVSLNLANADRTRATTPEDCPDYAWSFTTQPIYVSRECLQGDLRLRAGYNVSISQNTLSNTIQFSAILRAGLGEPCEEVKLFPEETPPIGSTNGLLEGDFYCNEVLRSINGVQGPALTIFAGSGVTITPDFGYGIIIVDVDLADLSLCTYSAVSV